MPATEWKSKLNQAHRNNLPLIMASLLCVQILSAVRDPVVIGWDLPFWLVLLDAVLIAIMIAIMLWVRSDSIPEPLTYPLHSSALV
jgi:hypothetical protein